MKFKTQAEKDAKQLLDSVITGHVKRTHRDVLAAEELLGVNVISTDIDNPADPDNPRKRYRIVRGERNKRNMR